MHGIWYKHYRYEIWKLRLVWKCDVNVLWTAEEQKANRSSYPKRHLNYLMVCHFFLPHSEKRKNKYLKASVRKNNQHITNYVWQNKFLEIFLTTALPSANVKVQSVRTNSVVYTDQWHRGRVYMSCLCPTNLQTFTSRTHWQAKHWSTRTVPFNGSNILLKNNKSSSSACGSIHYEGDYSRLSLSWMILIWLNITEETGLMKTAF